MSLANTAERQMLDLINQERAAAGLDPLRLNTLLNVSSETHSQWMIEADVFSHTGMGGSTATERMEAASYPFEGTWASGENIAWQSERGAEGIADDVAQLHQGLMQSPRHRANILNPNFTEIGIGIERGEMQGFDGVVVTQNFARTDADTSDSLEPDAAAPPVPAPEPVPEPVPEPTATAEPEPEQEPTPVAEPTPEVVLTPEPETDTSDGTDAPIGSEEDDQITATQDQDMVFGGAGNDEITGSDGQDCLDGGAGNDVISGGAGNDALLGWYGNDVLDGGDGLDFLAGEAGDDVMTGGANTDFFDFTAGNDKITDFTVGEDVVFLDASLVDRRENVMDYFTQNAKIADGNAVVDFGNGNTLTLEGVTDLTGADVFSFMC